MRGWSVGQIVFNTEPPRRRLEVVAGPPRTITQRIGPSRTPPMHLAEATAIGL